MTLANDSLVIDFGNKSDCDFDIFVEVDKNPCKPKETVTISVYGANIIDLEYIKVFKEEEDLGLGKIKSKTSDEEENIVFEKSMFAKAKFVIQSIDKAIAATSILKLNKSGIQSVYSAGSIVNVSKYKDSCIKIKNADPKENANLYGSIDLTYTANKIYKEFKWTAPDVEKTTTFPFFVMDKETEESSYEVIDTFNITVKNTYELTDIKFIIKDISNNEFIKDAIVTIKQPDNPEWIDLVETSDAKGEVIFSLLEGDTYDIYTTATDYIDSDKDYIHNDKFTVPVPEETNEVGE